MLTLTAETGELLTTSVKRGTSARERGRGHGARAKLKAAAALEEMADRCEKVARQIRQRVAGEPIKDWIVSLFDPVKHSQPLLRQEQTQSTTNGRARSLRGRFLSQRFIRGK